MRPRQGLILPVVLAVFCFLVLLAASHFFVAREQRATLFRVRLSENSRQVVISGLDEAFSWLDRETAEPSGETFRWFLETASRPLTLPLTVTRQFLTDFFPAPFFGWISASARITSFRTTSARGERFRCSPEARDAEGIFECRVDLFVFDSRKGNAKPVLELVGVRHHEFKVASMISPRNNLLPRSAYSHCFPLDHALLVRFGLEEFRRTHGQSLHADRLDLVIDQQDLPPENRGRVFFGGTDPDRPPTALSGETPQENFVFLNIPDALASQVIPWDRTLPAKQEEVLSLFPELEGRLRDYIRENGLEGGEWVDMLGSFRACTAPLPHDIATPPRRELEDRTIDLLCRTRSGAEARQPVQPGLAIVGGKTAAACDPAYVQTVLEGATRKRFLYQVSFLPDFSQARVKGWRSVPGGKVTETLPIPEFLTAEGGDFSRRIPCLPLPPDREGLSSRTVTFLERLPRVVEAHPEFPLFSRFEASFRYGGQEGDLVHPPRRDGFPQPRFFDTLSRPIEVAAEGPDGFRPYGFASLWLRNGIPAADLGGYDCLSAAERQIRPRGIVRIDGRVDLGNADGEPWSIRGQGVLVADGFRLLGGIRKSRPADLLVLVATNGAIEVDTDAPVEAVLIALDQRGGRSGTVVARRPLNLKGALICDRLGTTAWASGLHRIQYDPSLKNPASFSYQVGLSRRVRFLRVTEP